jgi:hypothetical protein
MELTVTIGKTYAVTSAAGCSVSTPDRVLIRTVNAGSQELIIAPTDKIVISDDRAKLTPVTFNLAPILHLLLNGGWNNVKLA